MGHPPPWSINVKLIPVTWLDSQPTHINVKEVIVDETQAFLVSSPSFSCVQLLKITRQLLEGFVFVILKPIFMISFITTITMHLIPWFIISKPVFFFQGMLFAYAVVKMNTKNSPELHLVAAILNKYRTFCFYDVIINSIFQTLWWSHF